MRVGLLTPQEEKRRNRIFLVVGILAFGLPWIISLDRFIVPMAWVLVGAAPMVVLFAIVKAWKQRPR